MRIAYITLHWPRSLSSSVGKKINTQINIWRKLGHSVKFFSHLHTIDENEPLVEGQRFYYQNKINIFSLELGRIRAAQNLLKSLKIFKPDLIYLRWSMYVHPMKRVFSIAPTIVEINTNDLKEHKLLGFAKDLYNRFTRSIFLGGAAGHIYTSNEMLADRNFYRFSKSFAVITNGIFLEETPFYPAPSNQIPRLIFIGTPGMTWQGTNKLINFAKKFKDIQIDIVGFEQMDGIVAPPENLFLHGYLQGKKYENLLKSADAAIGTLSLHLKGMEEASPFKIRDCAARGIPCILPYNDTDLSDLDCPEILNIPNTIDNIITHGDKIHDFIYKMRGRRLDRRYIENRIDINQKEMRRLDFFNRISQNSFS
jgi:glycosyltransferase involved in cell wall biosynthesis